MKAIALILSLFVSLLTMKPAMDAVHMQMTSNKVSSCCTVSCNAGDGKESSEDGGCKDKSCNVFGTCTSSSLQITEASELEVKNIVESTITRQSYYIYTISSRYVSDCWHPPRFV